jgi:hypothetical protein
MVCSAVASHGVAGQLTTLKDTGPVPSNSHVSREPYFTLYECILVDVYIFLIVSIFDSL